jgi:hypothetical protein
VRLPDVQKRRGEKQPARNVALYRRVRGTKRGSLADPSPETRPMTDDKVCCRLSKRGVRGWQSMGRCAVNTARISLSEITRPCERWNCECARRN